jgi:hypothetical protein
MMAGDPSSVPAGDNEDMFLTFTVDDDSTSLGARIQLAMATGYGDQYVAIISDAEVRQILWMAEGEPWEGWIGYNPARSLHAVSAHPLGDWNTLTDLDITYESRLFFSDKGVSVVLEWDAVIESLTAYDDDNQLSGWSLTGLQRGKNCSAVQNVPTQGRIDIEITTVGGTHTVTLSNGGVDVAEGSRTGDGAITLAEKNSSGVSGSVTIAYANDLALADAAYLGIRWAAGYYVHCATSLSFPRTEEAYVYDDGIANRFSATIKDLAAGTYSYVIQAYTDTGVVGTNTSVIGTVAVPGPPDPPGAISYVSGDYLATIVAFTNSATPGATYRLYDSPMDEPPNLTAVADTLAAGTPSAARQWTLPALAAPAAGLRRIVIVAVLAGVEDGYRRELAIEYDAAGNAVPARPNAPGMLASSISALTLTAQYTYDTAEQDAAATILQLFLVAEAATADWTRPDGAGSISATGTLRTGSISATAAADGWYRWAVRAATAPGAVANVYGDAASQLSAWSLTGAALTNTNYGLLYWTLADVAGTRTVSLYSNAAKTTLVAQGSRSGDGAITLAAQGGSGLSGSVTVAYTADDTDAANVIHTNRQSANTDLQGPLYLSDDVPAVPANVQATVVA